MISRRSLLAVPFLSLLSFNQKEVKERVLMDSCSYQKPYENDEFGKLYRRVLVVPDINHMHIIVKATLLKDKSLRVEEWAGKYSPYKITIFPENKWCINAYDACGELIKTITSDTFVS